MDLVSEINVYITKSYYVRKPSIFKLVALSSTDNVSEMQILAIFIKRALMIHKDCLLN